MLHASSPQAVALASDAVTNHVNRLASGRAPTSFAPWLCGSPLTALSKPNGGVRPIAVGEVIRRLVTKCLMARVRQPAQALLAPLQLGVAVKGGAEAIVHTVRRLITHHLDAAVSPYWTLQVDLSNAFNFVRRDVFCQSTLKHLHTVAPFATAFDNSMRSCLGRICQDDLSDAQWMQAGLPLSVGGLGLTHTARVSSAAVIGSAEYSSAVVLDLVPVSSCPWGPDLALHPARDHYHAQLCPTSSPLRHFPQRHLRLASPSRCTSARIALLSASDLRNKARLQSLTLSQAHAWLLVVPYQPSLQLKPAEFRKATRYRLGIADHKEEQVGVV
jgi:hypothetical protein